MMRISLNVYNQTFNCYIRPALSIKGMHETIKDKYIIRTIKAFITQ
jgi:hypothetical protein